MLLEGKGTNAINIFQLNQLRKRKKREIFNFLPSEIRQALLCKLNFPAEMANLSAVLVEVKKLELQERQRPAPGPKGRPCTDTRRDRRHEICRYLRFRCPLL